MRKPTKFTRHEEQQRWQHDRSKSCNTQHFLKMSTQDDIALIYLLLVLTSSEVKHFFSQVDDDDDDVFLCVCVWRMEKS